MPGDPDTTDTQFLETVVDSRPPTVRAQTAYFCLFKMGGYLCKPTGRPLDELDLKSGDLVSVSSCL